MKILVRSSDSESWVSATPVQPQNEEELQKLLEAHPSLIPIGEIRAGASPLVAAVRELGLPGSGYTDILAFTADGDIAVVECKLAANPEIRRKVIGQILEYAAYLWEMPYEELNRRVERIAGRPLVDLVAGSAPDDWDPDAFKEGVAQTLRDGDFVLIVAVDEINDELQRIVRYVNECSQSVFSLHAFEAQQFQVNDLEILVPHVHGVSARPAVAGTKRRQWTEVRFFDALEQGGRTEVTSTIRDLYEWTSKAADRLRFGTGTETGSFTFHYLRDGRTVSVFSVSTSEKLVLNYGYLSKRETDEVIPGFHHRLTSIPTFRTIPADFTRWPSLMVADALPSEEELTAFKEAVAWLGGEIHSTP